MSVNIFKCLIVFEIIIINISYAQNEVTACEDTLKSNLVQWANLGFGGADDFNNSKFISFGLSYHWKAKSITYSGGISHSSKFLSGTHINNFTAGVGKSTIRRFYVAGVTAGPGVIWSKQYNATISFNAQGHVAFTPITNLGVGAEFFSNLNKINNLFGIRLFIHLNDFKYK